MAEATIKKPIAKIEKAQSNGAPKKRLEILKTYKIYIGGKFPRTESGRYYSPENDEKEKLTNVCLSSRKDFREAVVAARKAQHSWAAKSAYNKGQILYRIAEMLEGRKTQFIEELMLQGSTQAKAEKEVELSIDRLVYYAGWSDKYQQVFSSVNPVESSHFNFSMAEPMGVISALSSENFGLIGLVSLIAPAIVGGNTIIVLAASEKPLCAVTFGEVINSSDVPGGVVNILTGHRAELLSHFANHMDVNAILYSGDKPDEISKIKELASLNVKRALIYKGNDEMNEDAQNGYRIMDTQEIKTTWHPVGQ